MGGSESTLQHRCFSEEIPHTAMPGFGAIRTSRDCFLVPDEIANLWHNFKVGLSLSQHDPYLGTRSRDMHGKAGAYTWITYQQAHDRAARISTGLQNHVKIGRQDVVGIFSKNRAEWVLTEMACNRMSYILVPLYDTLGPNVIPFILNHTSMRVLVASGSLIANVLAVKKDCPTLEYIISMDNTVRTPMKTKI